MTIIITWITLSFLVGILADSKGHSFFGFTLLSIALSPLIGCSVTLIVSPKKEIIEQQAIAEGDGKNCPDCGELVKAQAKICRFCRHEFI